MNQQNLKAAAVRVLGVCLVTLTIGLTSPSARAMDHRTSASPGATHRSYARHTYTRHQSSRHPSHDRAAVGSSAGRGDGPGYRVVHRIALGGEGGWDYLSADSDARRLYISRGDRVDVVDMRNNRIIGHISNTAGVHGIAIARPEGRGFTSNGGDGTVTIFKLQTLKEVGRVKVGDGPDAIVYDPTTRQVFTMNGRSQNTTAVNAATGKVEGTVSLPGRPEFAAADGKGGLFINIEDKSLLVRVDTRRLRVTGQWPLAPGEEPSGLAIDARAERLFSVCRNQLMTVTDGGMGKVLGTAAIGHGPDAAAFDPWLRLAFSSNGADGTLTVVGEGKQSQYHVLQTIKTAAGARTMALDSATHRIYLVTAKMQPTPPRAAEASGQPAGGRRRRSYVPGSFELLVVAR